MECNFQGGGNQCFTKYNTSCFLFFCKLCWLLQEAEIQKLEEEITLLQDPQRLIANGVVSPALETLQTENAKLLYQINHLKRVRMYLLAQTKGELKHQNGPRNVTETALT